MRWSVVDTQSLIITISISRPVLKTALSGYVVKGIVRVKRKDVGASNAFEAIPCTKVELAGSNQDCMQNSREMFCK